MSDYLDDMEAIKACPFCGRMARLIECDEEPNKGGVVVECHSCQASGPVVFSVKDDGRPHAIWAWNRRSTTSGKQAEPVGPTHLLKFICGNYICRMAGKHVGACNQKEKP